jgi:monoamine oxidase
VTRSRNASRRQTLALAAGGAAAAALPGRAGALPIREVDVAVLGAGAAGVAAARALIRAGVSVLMVEALRRSGGRCLTDTLSFPSAFDRGAHWLHAAEINPLARLGRDLGFDIYPAPDAELLVAGGVRAEAAEVAAYEAAVRGAEEAIIRFAEARADDAPAAQGLPRELGEWAGAVRFRLGPLDCGKTLADISAHDFARAPYGADAFCRPGVGTLVATLARGVPASLATEVSAVTVENGAVRLDTALGPLRARAAIVTASTAALASGRVRFTPDLDDQRRAAFDGLRLGAYLRVGVEMPGDPLGVEPDAAVYLRTGEERTFAALARVGGSDLWYLDTGGIYARELEAAGNATAIDVAKEWLVKAFGSDVLSRIRRAVATGWGREPTIGGAWSVASPGRAGARAELRRPHAERVLFAGEACHDTLWGTVAGAWETGEAAAREAIALVRG